MARVILSLRAARLRLPLAPRAAVAAAVKLSVPPLGRSATCMVAPSVVGQVAPPHGLVLWEVGYSS